VSDFTKHVEEQIAEDALNVRSELGLRGSSVDSFHRLLDTMQALLDVAKAAERLSLTGTHQYDLDEELLRALAKLQEQNK
jgi:hypothetical protein